MTLKGAALRKHNIEMQDKRNVSKAIDLLIKHPKYTEMYGYELKYIGYRPKKAEKL